MRIAIHYRHSDAHAKQLCDELNEARSDSASVHCADINNIADLPGLVEQAAHAHGGLHALVNNASSFYPTAVGTTSESQWSDLMGTNLKAPFFLSQAAAPWLSTSSGCIVNMADIYATRPLAGYAVYSVAKAGLVALTEALANELAPTVRVNAIAPGAILKPAGTAPETKDDALPQNPLNRWGEADEIAAAVLYLIRDATYTTGSVLAVDGGRRVTAY